MAILSEVISEFQPISGVGPKTSLLKVLSFRGHVNEGTKANARICNLKYKQGNFVVSAAGFVMLDSRD